MTLSLSLSVTFLPMLLCVRVCLCMLMSQTAASAKELEQYYSEAQIWLELLEEEVQQGENLKEEDFEEDKVSPHTHLQHYKYCHHFYPAQSRQRWVSASIPKTVSALERVPNNAPFWFAKMP